MHRRSPDAGPALTSHGACQLLYSVVPSKRERLNENSISSRSVKKRRADSKVIVWARNGHDSLFVSLTRGRVCDKDHSPGHFKGGLSNLFIGGNLIFGI